MKMSSLNLAKTDCDGTFEMSTEVEENLEDSLDSASSPVRRSTRLSKNDSRSKDALHKINRRTIMKPKRCFQPTTEKQIEAYYLNKKVVKRCTPLETIFEEPKVIKDKFTLLGNRKVNRSIKFTDGKNISKVTIQNRRKRIREMFGRAQKFKKVSMEYFLEHFTGVKSTESSSNQEKDLPSNSEFPPSISAP